MHSYCLVAHWALPITIHRCARLYGRFWWKIHQLICWLKRKEMIHKPSVYNARLASTFCTCRAVAQCAPFTKNLLGAYDFVCIVFFLLFFFFFIIIFFFILFVYSFYTRFNTHKKHKWFLFLKLSTEQTESNILINVHTYANCVY